MPDPELKYNGITLPFDNCSILLGDKETSFRQKFLGDL